jgi:hypothetical protein
MRPGPGSILLCAVLMAASWAQPPAAADGGGGGARPTHADLEAERRSVSVLETELALASTRKPYIVLDLGAATLEYHLLGMTPRRVALQGMHVEGLVPGGDDGDPKALAGIFTLAEKEGDPRLKPLSPEQVEAGDDDENAANILPPEPPKAYRLTFKQPIALQVAGREEPAGVRGLWTRVVDLWDRVVHPRKPEDKHLSVWVKLDATTAGQVYRSLLPDQRWLIVPPAGFTLPPAGQEAPPKPRAPRAIPPSPPKPVEPKEVPFRIPPPVDENGSQGDGSDAAGSGSGDDGGAASGGGAPRPLPAVPPGGGATAGHPKDPTMQDTGTSGAAGSPPSGDVLNRNK